MRRIDAPGTKSVDDFHVLRRRANRLTRDVLRRSGRAGHPSFPLLCSTTIGEFSAETSRVQAFWRQTAAFTPDQDGAKKARRGSTRGTLSLSFNAWARNGAQPSFHDRRLGRSGDQEPRLRRGDHFIPAGLGEAVETLGLMRRKMPRILELVSIVVRFSIIRPVKRRVAMDRARAARITAEMGLIARLRHGAPPIGPPPADGVALTTRFPGHT